MPRAAAEMGASQNILPLDGIARALRSKIGVKL
jgi:chemotaxis response regulator CheB